MTTCERATVRAGQHRSADEKGAFSALGAPAACPGRGTPFAGLYTALRFRLDIFPLPGAVGTVGAA